LPPNGLTAIWSSCGVSATAKQGWQEVLQLQQACWSGAAADYAEEWGRIVGTGLAVAKSDVAPLQGTLYRTAADAKARRAA